MDTLSVLFLLLGFFIVLLILVCLSMFQFWINDFQSKTLKYFYSFISGPLYWIPRLKKRMFPKLHFRFPSVRDLDEFIFKIENNGTKTVERKKNLK